MHTHIYTFFKACPLRPCTEHTDVTILTGIKPRLKCQVKPQCFPPSQCPCFLGVSITSSQLLLTKSSVTSQNQGLLMSMFALPHLAAPVFLERHISPR